MAAQRITESDQSGWIRSRWLAEKVSSGELPSAACELTRRCDAIFVAQDRLEEHADVLAGCLSVAGGSGGEAAFRSEDLSTYLRRLLALREMWARERS